MRRALPICVALIAAACNEPTLPPNHTPAYAFDTNGDVFHWPSDRLPVRFWADPRSSLRSYVLRGVDLWTDQFLYGEFRGTLVSDSTRADVIVVWSGAVPPDATPDEGTPVEACGGSTIPDFNPAGNSLTGPLHIYLNTLAGTFTPGQIAACIRRTAVHELGHSLGLFRHAADSLLIMNGTPWISVPAAGDRRTVEVLYHTSPTIAPPPR
jgi:hypothetical protein